MEKIKNDLAQEFLAIFADKLNNGGYEVIAEAADNVLLIRPAIINLDVNTPDTMVAGRFQCKDGESRMIQGDSGVEAVLIADLHSAIRTLDS